MSLDPKLRRDIRELSTLLGRILTEQGGKDLYVAVETIRRMTKSFRTRPSRSAAARIESYVQSMSSDLAHRVVRAFHTYFLLANAADEAQSIRLRSAGRGLPAPGLANPIHMAISSLTTKKTVSKAVGRFLQVARICPVFTAHPTEAIRQTVLHKLSSITRLIIEKDQAENRPLERTQNWERLTAEVTLLWQTSDVRSHKVDVQDEVFKGLYFFSDVLFDAVPRLCERIQREFKEVDPRARVIDPPVRLGSWMGGDRDGHPFVTPRVTRETLEQHRQTILERYEREIESLYPVLSTSSRIARIPVALQRWVRQERAMVELPASAMRTEPSETFRWALRVIHAKLKLTGKRKQGGYRTSAHFQRDLQRIDAALRFGEGDRIADQFISPLLWAVRAFGFSLASLDIRQNASLIRRAVASLIHRTDPVLDFANLPEEDRRTVLLRLLKRKGALLPERRRMDPGTRRILDEFHMVAMARRIHESSAVGSFILSNTEDVSDILCVLLLAKESGLVSLQKGVVISSSVDIVPLFETIADLRRSPHVLRSLLALPVYRSQLRKRKDRQEIMIGYSDSSKDGGIVSAAFELYSAQIALDAVARSHGVAPVFFHGRGGSISRGGGPVYESIVAQPRETMTGEIKITEQGEMISAKYLTPEIALYSLEVMVAAVLYGMGSPLSSADISGRASRIREFQAISAAARESYLSLTRHPHFWKFYRSVTPLDIIEKIEIGSRPASRTPRTSLESIRAIPWVFSWTQCRLAITGWYGFGTAIESVVRARTSTWTDLRRMYRGWTFFRTLVDNMEMVLAKTDLVVGEGYLALGVHDPSSDEFSRCIREEYERTRHAVLRIKQNAILLEDEDALRQSLQLRNPYLDPIHFIQIRFLREFRASRSESPSAEKMLDLLRSSVNGIASGMRNTG